jgi:hypothetical protein
MERYPLCYIKLKGIKKIYFGERKIKNKTHYASRRYYIVKGVFDNNFNPYLINN